MKPEYCQFCPRRSAAYPGLPGACSFDGPDAAPFLIVGMAPGEHELGGAPFVGPSGALLWGIGQKVGLSRPQCRILNVSRCSPCGGRGRTLSQPQIGACWNDFNESVLSSQAKVVILLGGDALRRVTGLKGIDDYRGFLLSADQLRAQVVTIPTTGQYKTSRRCPLCKGNGRLVVDDSPVAVVPLATVPCSVCAGVGWAYRKGDPRVIRAKLECEPVLPPSAKWVLATYHPSHVMRSGRKNLRAFLNDLDRAVRAYQGKLDVKKYTFAERPQLIGHNGLVAFDIENTGGLDGAIDRIGFSGSAGTWSAPWNHESREAARYELGDPNRIKVAHNIQHDLRHLEAEGVAVPGTIFDTMWAGMVLEPDLPMGLRSMAPLWLDLHGCWKDEWKRDPTWYNAHDAGITRDLAHVLIQRHQDLGSYGGLMRLIMPSLRVLMDMRRRGIKVDLAWMGPWSRRLVDRKRRLERLWVENGGYTLDPASHVECGRLLYDTMGLKEVRDPDNDNKRTTAAWALRLLIQQYPEYRNMLRTLLAYRKVDRLLATCAVSLGPDGCVHPHFGPSWKDQPDEGFDGTRAKRKGTTSTLRLSVAADGGLNLQQIPKHARRMYVAPPGYVFVKADIDRAEPWVYATLANDPALIHELTHGDPYEAVAASAGAKRPESKALFLARMYGAGPKKGRIILAKQGIDAPTQTVSRIFDSIVAQFPRTEAFRNQVAYEAVNTGRLRSGFGFVREFLGGDRDIPEAMDWVAQHNVACILWSLFVPLHEMAKSLGGWLQLSVYDEVLLCVPSGKEREAAKSMVEIMTTERPEIARGFRPRVSEVLVGQNWRDMHALPL